MSDAPAVRRAVVMGGSAGAVEAVSKLLAGLPPGFALPVVVIIHQPRRKPNALLQLLSLATALPVREPEDKEPLAPSTVYVAPPGYHLLIDSGPSFGFSVDPPVNFSIPSIDVLFESAADALGAGVGGVLLSGANEDGARGLAAIDRAEGLALVQSPQEALYRAMPEAAIAVCPGAQVLSLEGIGRFLLEFSASGPAEKTP